MRRRLAAIRPQPRSRSVLAYSETGGRSVRPGRQAPWSAGTSRWKWCRLQEAMIRHSAAWCHTGSWCGGTDKAAEFVRWRSCDLPSFAAAARAEPESLCPGQWMRGRRLLHPTNEDLSVGTPTLVVASTWLHCFRDTPTLVLPLAQRAGISVNPRRWGRGPSVRRPAGWYGRWRPGKAALCIRSWRAAWLRSWQHVLPRGQFPG